MTLQYNYSILPNPEDLARELVKKDLHEKDPITNEEMEACILDWSIDNLPNSSRTRQYHEGRQWLDAQLRLAVKEVDVLKNKIVSILPSEVVEIMMAIETHYTELDDFDKWRVSRPFDMLEVINEPRDEGPNCAPDIRSGNFRRASKTGLLLLGIQDIWPQRIPIYSKRVGFQY